MKNQCDKYSYYDHYKIMDGEIHLGYIEDHCRDVKQRYFIAWRRKFRGMDIWETTMFNTWDECITWIKEV